MLAAARGLGSNAAAALHARIDPGRMAPGRDRPNFLLARVYLCTRPDTRAKLDELSYLRKSIGRTMLLAVHQHLRTSHKELWQITMAR